MSGVMHGGICGGNPPWTTVSNYARMPQGIPAVFHGWFSEEISRHIPA